MPKDVLEVKITPKICNIHHSFAADVTLVMTTDQAVITLRFVSASLYCVENRRILSSSRVARRNSLIDIR